MNQIIKYYEDLAESYDVHRFSNTYGQFIDRQERKILAELLSNQNGLILDLACGSGRLMNYASHGLDASKNMISIAQKKFPDKQFYNSDAEDTGLKENSFDIIICFHFFMHLDENKVQNILIECNRLLRENGKLIVDIPSSKRRNLFNYKSTNWHGAYSANLKTFHNLNYFKLKRSFGILFLPIHRFPAFMRKVLIKFDLFLANSFLKEYSSYLIFEFEKFKK